LANKIDCPVVKLDITLPFGGKVSGSSPDGAVVWHDCGAGFVSSAGLSLSKQESVLKRRRVQYFKGTNPEPLYVQGNER
jgi:hypothetical protein